MPPGYNGIVRRRVLTLPGVTHAPLSCVREEQSENAPIPLHAARCSLNFPFPSCAVDTCRRSEPTAPWKFQRLDRF